MVNKHRSHGSDGFSFSLTYPFNPNNPWLINTDRTDLTEAVRDPSLSFAEGEIAAALSRLFIARPRQGATTGKPFAIPHLHAKKNAPSQVRFPSRKVRDSNPRYPQGVYRISSPAHSITLPTFLCGCKISHLFINDITFDRVFLKEQPPLTPPKGERTLAPELPPLRGRAGERLRAQRGLWPSSASSSSQSKLQNWALRAALPLP